MKKYKVYFKGSRIIKANDNLKAFMKVFRELNTTGLIEFKIISTKEIKKAVKLI